MLDIIQLSTFPNISSGNRIRVFDAIRGFAILLVVFGHALMMCGLSQNNSFVYYFITTFYMPLFFFISGFFGYKKFDKWHGNTLKRNFTKKICALFLGSVIFYALLLYTQNQNPLGWTQDGFGYYWFTITLFEIFCIYYLCIVISKILKRNFILQAMIGCSLLGLAMMMAHIFEGMQFWTAMEGSNLCYFMQFFTLGLLFRKFEHKVLPLIRKDAIKTLLIIAYIILICIVSSSDSVNTSIYGKGLSWAMPYIGVLTIVSIFYAYEGYFEKKSLISTSLCLFGQRSLDIYMIHYFFLPSLTCLSGWLLGSDMMFFQIATGLGIAVPVIGLSLIVSNALRSSNFITRFLFNAKKITE